MWHQRINLMKILQVTPYFYPNTVYGSIGSIAYNLSKRLIARRQEVTVYTTDANDKHSRLSAVKGIKDIGGIKIHYIKNISNLLAFNQRLFMPVGMVLTAKNIKGFDIIHLHDFRTFQNIVVYHFARRYDIPYVLQAHGTVPRIIEKQGLKKSFDVLWGHKILQNARKLIALNKKEKEQYKNMGVNENKIEILPNGIEFSEYEDLPTKGEFRKKYSIGYDEKVILFLGKIHKVKGLDLLVKSFADLLKLLVNTRLIVVGPDFGYLRSLRKLTTALKISDKVLFTGPLYQRDKLEVYIDADIYVLPSVSDAMPMTVIEACACGTPVIVTDRCGIAQWVHGNAGYVVQRNEDQLKTALLKLLDNKSLRIKFGENARRLVQEHFEWRNIVSRITDLYQDVLSKY